MPIHLTRTCTASDLLSCALMDIRAKPPAAMLLIIEQKNGTIDLVPWPPADSVMLGMLDLGLAEASGAGEEDG